MSVQKYWIAVVSKDHVLKGTDGGFMQVCRGKPAPLKRMKSNDWVIFYSPREWMNGESRCQSFTAIGQTTDENVYQYQMRSDFVPFRRNVKFYHCEETSILPLISELDFIQDKRKWGFQFRLGFFEINKSDFNLIMSKMLSSKILSGRRYPNSVKSLQL